MKVELISVKSVWDTGWEKRKIKVKIDNMDFEKECQIITDTDYVNEWIFNHQNEKYILRAELYHDSIHGTCSRYYIKNT
jgi:hypothetical protein